MNTTRRFLFTAGALLLIIIRAIRPDWLKADVVTVFLIVSAILPWALPWLSSFLESAKLPGGLDLVFRKLKDKVDEQEKKVVAQEKKLVDQQAIINQLVVYAMAQHLFDILHQLHQRIQSGGEYLFRDKPDFRRDLFYLRDNGFIESNQPGVYLNVNGLRDGQNLLDVVKLAPIGDCFVKLRDKMQRGEL